MRKKNMKIAFAVMALVLSLALLGGCSGQPTKSTPTIQTEKTESEPTATSAQAVVEDDEPSADEVQVEGRIMELIRAWADAGISAEFVETQKSGTLNSMYGSIRQQVIRLDDQQFIILEYDLENLNSTATRIIGNADEHGRDLKSGDPAWHNQEFLLRNTYSELADGEVVNEYKIESHPKSQQILEVFQAFK